jgi:uncharacterized protein (TIGR03503 family)
MTVRKQLLHTLVIFLLSFVLVNASQADVSPKADVRVLIDISGSMKQNDPQNLRKPAVELLVKLLPDSASAGIWTFAENSRFIVPDRSVTEAWRKSALSGANQITSTGLFTNIPLALKAATKDIAAEKAEKDYHIILLTDGMIDISKSPEANDAARKQFINDTLPELRKLGVKIHTIALSNNADKLLMEKIAIDTGGLSETAETADQLAKIFVQALDVAAPREQVPLKGNKFAIDKSIDEFTMLIFRKKTEEKITLIAPGEKRYSAESKSADVKWFHNEGYDLVTMKKPVAGEWSIEGELQPGSRVTIVSNLSLQASRFPSSFFIGADDVIKAELTENKKPITQAEFLKLTDMSVTVRRRDDNQFWQQPLALNNDVAGDAPFTSQLLGQTGTYDLTVKANGKTFEREQHQTVSVYDAFEVIVVAGKELPPIHKVTLIPRNPDIVAANSKVIAHVKNPDGTDAEPVAVLQANETWQLDLRDDKHSGEFRIWFEIEAKDRNGKVARYKTTPKSIIHLVPGEISQVEKVEAPKPVEKPTVEKVTQPKPDAEKKSALDLPNILTMLGIVLGNVVVLGLGFYMYKTLMKASKKSILEQSDDDVDDDSALSAAIAAEEAALAATGDVLPVVKVAPPPPPPPEPEPEEAPPMDDFPDEIVLEEPLGDMEDVIPKQEDDEDDFALPDDAIDIDPDADDDKK